jgi:taurine dioxygenase
MSGLDIHPVAGALGAAVTGIDLRTVTDVEALEGLKKALADNLVVFLPDQHLDLDDLERITDLLGGRDVTPYVAPLPGRPT